MRILALPFLLAAALLGQAPDRLVLKSGRVLEGTIECDAVDAVRFRDRELGVIRVSRTALAAVEAAGVAPGVLGRAVPDDPGDRPEAYIRWLRPRAGEAGGLQTATGRWYDRPSDTTLLMVGVVHVGDPAYFGELQKVLDMSDLVLFEGVGRGTATDEQLARMDAMMRMQLALRGALGLGFQKDHIDYRRDFWVNSDVEFGEVLRALEERGAALPTDNPIVRGLLQTVLGAVSGGGRREPRLQDQLKRQMGPILAQADEIMRRPGFAGMRGAIIEHRNAKVMADIERELAEGAHGRRIAVFYGAGHLPDLDLRLLEAGLEFQGSAWHTAWSVDARPPRRTVDIRALDDLVRAEIDAHGDPGLEVSIWLSGPDGAPHYAWKSEAVRAAASSIKTAYLVELFAEFADHLDLPMPGLDAILDDPTHPALVHFTAEERTEIVAALRGASVRRVAQMMIHGVGVSNVVYNAAANVTTAALGGPDGLTSRLRARFGDGAWVRRYMLAPRDVTGDNEVTAEYLGRVLQRIAGSDLRGLSEETVAGIRDQLFLKVEADGARHLSKTGALDTPPMTRNASGILQSADGPPLVYVVMCERADAGSRELADAVTALEESRARLTHRLLDEVRRR